MKKRFVYLFFVIIISLQITGCIKQPPNITTNVNPKIEITVKKTDSEIREIAYQSIGEDNKKIIINWKDATVEENKYTTSHSVGSPKGLIDIKDKDTYKVVFRTTNEGLMGPITIYLNKNSYDILGGDLRQ